jgi:negative regulator of flagellin synthesis FlgM
MTIESINNKLPVTSRSAPKTANSKTNVDKVSSTDRVDTSIADKIKSALASQPNTPPVNAEKVASLRQAIANGTYKIDANQIAAKLLNMDQQLPDNGPIK